MGTLYLSCTASVLKIILKVIRYKCTTQFKLIILQYFSTALQKYIGNYKNIFKVVDHLKNNNCAKNVKHAALVSLSVKIIHSFL